MAFIHRNLLVPRTGAITKNRKHGHGPSSQEGQNLVPNPTAGGGVCIHIVLPRRRPKWYHGYHCSAAIIPSFSMNDAAPTTSRGQRMPECLSDGSRSFSLATVPSPCNLPQWHHRRQCNAPNQSQRHERMEAPASSKLMIQRSLHEPHQCDDQ